MHRQGRVACEITTTNELLLTELVFNNSLTPLRPAEIVALLSATVFQQRRCSEPTLTPTLQTGMDVMKATAASIAEVQVEFGGHIVALWVLCCSACLSCLWARGLMSLADCLWHG